MSSSMSIISTALAMLALTVGPSRAAEEPAPTTFVALKFEGACDTQNNRLWLTNSHTFKTVVAKVRWRAAGGTGWTRGVQLCCVGAERPRSLRGRRLQ